jgi:hypothetical protein
LASGQTSSEATCVNSAGVIGGYVFIPGGQRGCVWNGGAASVITKTARSGSYFIIVYGINEAGRIIGMGRDPNVPGRYVGMVYDLGGTEAVEVGAMPNSIGSFAEGVSNAGHVAGTSNVGGGIPFIWTPTTGTVAIPLPQGTQSAGAHAVNSSGWAVGEAFGQSRIPFLYVGSATYNLFDLIPPNHGWSVDNCNQCGVRSINDNGVIVGTALLNQQQTAFAMVPVAIGPLPSAAVSRKTHGTAGNFDVVLPFSGAAGVESRNAAPAGDHQIIVTFPTAVTFTSAAVTVGTGSVASASVSGGAITVNLTGVSDAQTLTVRINGVSNGSQPADVDIRMSILIADANGDRVVNTADALQTRSRSGQATDASNFRSDINVDGFVNSGDVLVVRGRSGNSVP